MIQYIIQVPKNYSSSASYNRVRLFKKGFDEKNIESNIFRIIIAYGGLISNIKFFVKNYFRLLILLLKLSKNDILIIYGETYFHPLYSIFSKKTNLVIERTEYPAYMINETLSARSKKNSKANLVALKHARAIITCSSALKQFYSQYVENVIISPLIVDIDEMLEKNESQLDNRPMNNYIAYCGNFGNNKDGVPTLIEAFAQISTHYPDLNLVLIGSGPQIDLDLIKGLINKNKLTDRVIFTGLLPHNEVYLWLKKATILALARPNNKQAEGGVPSKVGEYLSTGVPCVITNVGDMPSYLKDGYDCILSEPDSIIDFASSLRRCLNSDMKTIGHNAQTTVRQFNCNKQSELVYNQLYKIFKCI